jgi:hypothetical protein
VIEQLLSRFEQLAARFEQLERAVGLSSGDLDRVTAGHAGATPSLAACDELEERPGPLRMARA